MGAFIRRRTELYVALRRADLLMAASPERCAEARRASTAPRSTSTCRRLYFLWHLRS